MKLLPLIPLTAAASLVMSLSLSADVIVQYGTGPGPLPLAASGADANVTAADLTAGTGIAVATGATWNWNAWDDAPANTTWAEAVTDNDTWTWGFTVDSVGVILTTMDIRVDRSGSGPPSFEIQAVVTPSGGSPGAPISILAGTTSTGGDSYFGVDLSSLGPLAVGDSISFIFAAWGGTSSGGTCDLEEVSGSEAIILNGHLGLTPKLSVVLDQTVLFEDAPIGSGLHTGTVSRSGPRASPVTVNIVSSAPGTATVDATATILASEGSATFEFDPAGDIVGGAQVVTFDFTATGYDPTSADVTVLDDETITADVVINELLNNVTGIDSEFVELFNNSGGPLDIQGWTFKAYSADIETLAFGAETASVTIPTGVAVNLADQGFFLIANSQFEAIYTPVTADLLAPLDMDNQSVTFALFDAGGNLVYAASSSDGDGIPNLGGSEIVDGVGTPFTPDIEFGPDGANTPAGYRFVADGGGYFETLEFAPQPSESATPGATNVIPAEFILTFSPVSINEADGPMASVGTVTRRYIDPSSPVVVTLTDDDVDDSEISIPATVTILANETSVDFDVDALDELDVDGLQTVTVTAASAGYVSGMGILSVGDDDSPPPVLSINEVWADDTGTDDAEYVEIFGPGNTSLAGFSFIVVDGDTAGSTTSTNYRRVTQQIDFTTETIPSDGYFVIGAGITPNVDLSASTNWLQNNSQTYAIVVTSDIAYEAGDPDELTQASVDAISLNALDAIATLDGSVGDHSYFGAPVLTDPLPDLMARNGDGVDTESVSDWNVQSNSSHELGDPTDTLSTPGITNIIITAPVDLEITSISLVSPTTVGIGFIGAASTTYVLKSDANLQGGFVTVVPATGGSLTTDVSGNATVEFAFNPGELYFRIEE